MFKNLLIVFFGMLLLNNCGYSPIYSKNIDHKLNIELINFEGDREINNSIKYTLKRYGNQINEPKFLIITNSQYNKISETKNLAGNTISYSLSASVNFNVTYENKEKIFNFTETSTLNNIASQIDEDIYEKNIKKNFGELFSDRLIMQLINMK